MPTEKLNTPARIQRAERNAKIIAAYKAGHPIKVIAAEFRVSLMTVSCAAQGAGLRRQVQRQPRVTQ